MEIRFVEPAEVEQLRRNVQTAFPSKTPQALLDNMPGELVRPEEGRYLGCFDDDGTMIGSLLMMDFEMNVRGKTCLCIHKFSAQEGTYCKKSPQGSDGGICTDRHGGWSIASI